MLSGQVRRRHLKQTFAPFNLPMYASFLSSAGICAEPTLVAFRVCVPPEHGIRWNQPGRHLFRGQRLLTDLICQSEYRFGVTGVNIPLVGCAGSVAVDAEVSRK